MHKLNSYEEVTFEESGAHSNKSKKNRKSGLGMSPITRDAREAAMRRIEEATAAAAIASAARAAAAAIAAARVAAIAATMHGNNDVTMIHDRTNTGVGASPYTMAVWNKNEDGYIGFVSFRLDTGDETPYPSIQQQRYNPYVVTEGAPFHAVLEAGGVRKMYPLRNINIYYDGGWKQQAVMVVPDNMENNFCFSFIFRKLNLYLLAPNQRTTINVLAARGRGVQGPRIDIHIRLLCASAPDVPHVPLFIQPDKLINFRIDSGDHTGFPTLNNATFDSLFKFGREIEHANEEDRRKKAGEYSEEDVYLSTRDRGAFQTADGQAWTAPLVDIRLQLGAKIFDTKAMVSKGVHNQLNSKVAFVDFGISLVP
jgi:hypothetical protein